MRFRVDRWLPPLLNLLLTAGIAAILFLVIGISPAAAFRSLAEGAFGSRDGIGYTLFYTTDFILTGLAVAIPYRAGLFNIGAEGQAVMGGIAVALACRALPAGRAMLPLAILAAALGGALWAALPGWLQARRGSNVVITTIMFNVLAAAVAAWLLVDIIRAPGDPSPETLPLPPEAAMPVLLAGTPLNLSLPVAVVLAVLAELGFARTIWGFAVDVTGANRDAAAYAGIEIGRVSIAAMCIGGGVAGLMAVNEVLGAEHRLALGFSAGFGFIGIAVALMANCRPLVILATAFLFGALYQGGTELALDSPKVSQDIILAINGAAVLICGGLSQVWQRPLRRLFGAKGRD